MFDIIKILFHYINAKKIPRKFKTKQDLEDWQKIKLEQFINNTLSKSPFYKKYMGKNFKDFPIINKKIMSENFYSMNTAGIELEEALYIATKAEHSRDFSPMINNITIGLSSGTSGKQSVFLASYQERLKWAGIMLAKAMPGSIFQKHKIAFFLRANSNLYKTLSTTNRVRFNFFDLTLDFKKNLNKLDKLKPTILTAPASVLKLIAKAKEKGQIDIAPIRIFSVAEVLEPQDQKYIEHIFHNKVFQIYQCTEGFLGITNNNGKIYLNEEYLYIEKEWIDKKNGRFIPIITDFTRTTQPIVRYRLDDVLIEDLKDESPFTCIKEIEGRVDDIIYLTSLKRKIKPIFSDIIRRAITLTDTDFDEYKIIQNSIDKIEIQTSPNSQLIQDKIKQSFNILCQEQECILPEIIFKDYDKNPLDKKLKRIERNLQIERQEII